MTYIERYNKKLWKDTEKLCRKLFNYRTISDALVACRFLRKDLESVTNMDISEISTTLACKVGKGYEYAKYLTLSQILGVLEKAVKLETFLDIEKEDVYEV